MDSMLTCLDDQRRLDVHTSPLNGFDYVEVGEDHKTLKVFFLGKAPSNPEIGPHNLVLEGGRRITGIQIVQITVERDPEPHKDDWLVVTVDKGGDFSPYRLCAVQTDERGRPILDGYIQGLPRYRPFNGFDPRFACVDVSFMTDCPSNLDCKTEPTCPPPQHPESEINYLAKDYASFRQLILDRLSVVMPDWQERHVPDLWVTLVELLAYVGDHLSYHQDAVGTEAYLDTARQRISVRRHARLVDYRMHEGCNARTWVCIGTDAGHVPLDPHDIYFMTMPTGFQDKGMHIFAHSDLGPSLKSSYEIFMPQTIPSGGEEKACQDAKTRVNDALCHRSEAERDEVFGKLHSELSSRARRAVQALREQPSLCPTVVAEVQRDLAQRDDKLIHVYQAHERIRFYTWGDKECCLPSGSTSATLRDEWDTVAPQEEDSSSVTQQKPVDQRPAQLRISKLRLRVGDVLILKEEKGPKTGSLSDADPEHRHAVRLTAVEPMIDPLYSDGAGSAHPVPLVHIEWDAEDALPFPLCLSSRMPAPVCEIVEDVSVASGNVLLVDHGQTRDDAPTAVPVKETNQVCLCGGTVVESTSIPDDITIDLVDGPLTFGVPIPAHGSATSLLVQDPRQALPHITLREMKLNSTSQVEEIKPVDGDDWDPRYDLLGSRAADRHFVAEMDNDGKAHLRFGDDAMGARPEAGLVFTPHYRIGNGSAGNVGRDTIRAIVFRRGSLSGIRLQPTNPLAAGGGLHPEPLSEVKLFAPHAFRERLERAITADDYARLSERHPALQRAAASLQWTGSWYKAAVALDPKGTDRTSDSLLRDVAGMLHRYRKIGHELVVLPARKVPILLEVDVCVEPHYLRGHVEAALRERFSNRTMADGRLGFFSPDSLTFGESVYLSKIVAVAQSLAGVQSVRVTKLERYGEGDHGEIDAGVLNLGSMEIVQLDNDRNHQERGVLALRLRGGR